MQNLFPVNLEFLQFVDLNDPEQLRLTDATLVAELRPLSGLTQADKDNTLILGTAIWEYATEEKNLKPNFLYFREKCQSLGIRSHFLLGQEKKSILTDFENCTYIDFFILLIYYFGTLTGQKSNKKWCPENKKFLFLMGKPLKPHRLGLLYRFYKQGILNNDRAIWSFHGGITVDDCKGQVPESASQQELEILINDYKRSPDQISPANNHHKGYWFDSSLYEKTNLSVVSETHFYLVWNTEKIYRAILNCHPFIIAGGFKHTEYLKNLGFETFDQYFAIPEYSSISDLSQKLDAIVDNVKQFDPTPEQIEAIQQATQKNLQRFNDLATQQIDIVYSMAAEYGITKSWDQIVPFKDPEFFDWQYYYQKIKDPSWPPCASFSDCVNLPAVIQEELRTRFKVEF